MGVIILGCEYLYVHKVSRVLRRCDKHGCLGLLSMVSGDFGATQECTVQTMGRSMSMADVAEKVLENSRNLKQRAA